jgi:probable HAF family extracellular repeat protein
MVFPPTAPWWSAGLTTPQGMGVPFAGRRLVGCKTSARWAACERAYAVSADGAVVVGWAYNAAGQDRAFRWTASGRDARPRHAGRRLERGLWGFRRRRRGGRLG